MLNHRCTVCGPVGSWPGTTSGRVARPMVEPDRPGENSVVHGNGKNGPDLAVDALQKQHDVRPRRSRPQRGCLMVFLEEDDFAGLQDVVRRYDFQRIPTDRLSQQRLGFPDLPRDVPRVFNHTQMNPISRQIHRG